MKLPTTNIKIESSDEMAEKFFSIGDDNKGMIFELLRSKIYSNPIQAICREISCNARDAMREAGKPGEPIQILLPNTLEPYLKIKDQGVGISPDRAENVFVKFGSSTKRNDNNQTGGFGLGCKVPLSYSDSFAIETIYDGTKYNYSAIIDETRVGKLITLSTEDTTEPNGTEVSIPIKAADYRTFQEGIEYACRHWDIKPIIKNDTITYNIPNYTLSGDNWKLSNDGESKIRLIIDQIEYPLNEEELKNDKINELVSNLHGDLYLFFKTGEISLSANRENIHLDKQTKEKISKRLDNVIDSFAETIQQEVDKQTNLHAANVYFHTAALSNFYSIPSFLVKKIKFQGIELSDKNTINIGDLANSVYFSKSSYINYQTKYNNNIAQYISKSYARGSFTFKQDTKVILLDIKKSIDSVQIADVAQYFIDNPTLDNAFVVAPAQCQTYNHDTNKYDFEEKTWDEVNQKYHFDLMDPINLSSIKPYEEKAKKAAKTAANNTVEIPMIIYKFDAINQRFMRSSKGEMENDNNKKALCELKLVYCYPRNRMGAISKTDKDISDQYIAVFAKQSPKVSIYGISKYISKKKRGDAFKGFQDIEDLMKVVLAENKENICYEEIKYALNSQYLSYGFLGSMRDYSNSSKDAQRLLSKVSDQKSPASKWLATRATMLDNIEKYKLSLSLYEGVNGSISEDQVSKWIKKNPNKNIIALGAEAAKAYPFLQYITYDNSKEKQIAEYINLMDAANKKAKRNKTKIKE